MTIEDGGRHIEGVQARCADTINGVRCNSGRSGENEGRSPIQPLKTSDWAWFVKRTIPPKPLG